MDYTRTSSRSRHFFYQALIGASFFVTGFAFANEEVHSTNAKSPQIAVPATKPVREAVSSAPPAAVPKKAKPSSTPEEVAAKIAERIAKLMSERNQKNIRPVRAHKANFDSKSRETTAALHEAGQGAAKYADTHWSYAGESGPLRWSEMNPEWAKCGTGNRQSPIDIRSGIKVDLEPINFDYRPSGFTVIDNGHTIQVNIGSGNYITVANRIYELVQFHFHRPSEERVNGRAFEMVVHLVHKDVSGKLAVVAVLIERGAARSLIQTIWNNLPLEKNETVTPKGVLDMNTLLPAKREYFTYMGSLTTPPCTEGVLWMVMKEPVPVSQEQIDIFARLYQMNARPIQGTSERMIKESN